MLARRIFELQEEVCLKLVLEASGNWDRRDQSCTVINTLGSPRRFKNEHATYTIVPEECIVIISTYIGSINLSNLGYR